MSRHHPYGGYDDRPAGRARGGGSVGRGRPSHHSAAMSPPPSFQQERASQSNGGGAPPSKAYYASDPYAAQAEFAGGADRRHDTSQAGSTPHRHGAAGGRSGGGLSTRGGGIGRGLSSLPQRPPSSIPARPASLPNPPSSFPPLRPDGVVPSPASGHDSADYRGGRYAYDSHSHTSQYDQPPAIRYPPPPSSVDPTPMSAPLHVAPLQGDPYGRSAAAAEGYASYEPPAAAPTGPSRPSREFADYQAQRPDPWVPFRPRPPASETPLADAAYYPDYSAPLTRHQDVGGYGQSQTDQAPYYGSEAAPPPPLAMPAATAPAPVTAGGEPPFRYGASGPYGSPPSTGARGAYGAPRFPERPGHGKTEEERRFIEERIGKERPCRTLFVRNINFETDAQSVRQRFEHFGEVKSFFDLVERRGIIFISFFDIRAAAAAKEQLNGALFGGRPIDVHYSLPREEDKAQRCDRDKNQGTLFVSLKRTSERLDDDRIHEVFSQYGDVKSIRRDMDQPNARMLEFYDSRGTQLAHDTLNGTSYMGGVWDLKFAWDLLTNEAKDQPHDSANSERWPLPHADAPGGNGDGRGTEGSGPRWGREGGGRWDSSDGHGSSGREPLPQGYPELATPAFPHSAPREGPRGGWDPSSRSDSGTDRPPRSQLPIPAYGAPPFSSSSSPPPIRFGGAAPADGYGYRARPTQDPAPSLPPSQPRPAPPLSDNGYYGHNGRDSVDPRSTSVSAPAPAPASETSRLEQAQKVQQLLASLGGGMNSAAGGSASSYGAGAATNGVGAAPNSGKESTSAQNGLPPGLAALFAQTGGARSAIPPAQPTQASPAPTPAQPQGQNSMQTLLNLLSQNRAQQQ